MGARHCLVLNRDGILLYMILRRLASSALIFGLFLLILVFFLDISYRSPYFSLSNSALRFGFLTAIAGSCFLLFTKPQRNIFDIFKYIITGGILTIGIWAFAFAICFVNCPSSFVYIAFSLIGLVCFVGFVQIIRTVLLYRKSNSQKN
jgi:hypothetical protein